VVDFRGITLDHWITTLEQRIQPENRVDSSKFSEIWKCIRGEIAEYLAEIHDFVVPMGIKSYEEANGTM
jgi:hypothetical protein